MTEQMTALAENYPAATELLRLHGGDIATETALRAAAEQLDAADAFKANANSGGR